MNEEKAIWKCDTCGTIFAEYVNGCPKCSERGIRSKVASWREVAPPGPEPRTEPPTLESKAGVFVPVDQYNEFVDAKAMKDSILCSEHFQVVTHTSPTKQPCWICAILEAGSRPSAEPRTEPPARTCCNDLAEAAAAFADSTRTSDWKEARKHQETYLDILARHITDCEAGSRPSVPAPNAEVVFERSNCRCDCSPYCNCPCHGPSPATSQVLPQENLTADLQQEARKIVDIVATEFNNFDGYDRAVQRVAAHLRGK